LSRPNRATQKSRKSNPVPQKTGISGSAATSKAAALKIVGDQAHAPRLRACAYQSNRSRTQQKLQKTDSHSGFSKLLI
jgi:hypothetical protein